MSKGTDHDKAAKKETKAAAKATKKEAKAAEKAGSAAPGQPPVGAATTTAPQPSPAERSAAAAEQQVRLHNRRMWISLAGVLVALVTLVLGLLSIQ